MNSNVPYQNNVSKAEYQNLHLKELRDYFELLTSNTAKNIVKSSTFARRTLIVRVTFIVVWIDSFRLLFTTCSSPKEKTVRVIKNDKEDKKENKNLIQLHFASQLLQ